MSDLPPAPPRAEWHIKREVTMGHIISTVLLAGGLASAYNDVNSRVLKVEEQHNTSTRIMMERSSQTSDFKNSVNGRLDRIEAKLDRLIDRHLDLAGARK